MYKVDGKYIKIKTFGLLLKIGDICGSHMHPKDDLYILGQGNDMEKTIGIFKHMNSINFSPHNIFYSFMLPLPFSLFVKTVGFKILSKYPYSEMAKNKKYEDCELLKKFLTPIELLEEFGKYFVKDIGEFDETVDLLVG